MTKRKRHSEGWRRAQAAAVSFVGGPQQTFRAVQVGRLSVLEQAATRPHTEWQCKEAAAGFLRWCQLFHLVFQNLVQLDALLVQYFPVLFADGLDGAAGSVTVAALRHFFPSLGPTAIGALPRAMRAITGWRKIVPPQMRLPLPRAAAAAIAGMMILLGEPSWQCA